MTFNVTRASETECEPSNIITKDIEINTLEELMTFIKEHGEDIIIYQNSVVERQGEDNEHYHYGYDKIDKPTICIYDYYVE